MTLRYLSSWLLKRDVAHKKLQRQKQAANHGYIPQPSLHLCHNSPLPYFGRRQRTGICYLDDIRQVCLTFMPSVLQGISAKGSATAVGFAQRCRSQGPRLAGSPRVAGSALVTDWEEPSAGIQLNPLLYLKCFRNLKNRLSNAIIKLSVNLCNKIHQQRRWVI